MKRVLVAAVAALAVVPGPARAQGPDDDEPLRPVVAWFGGGIEGAQTVGEFSNYVTGGFGGSLFFLIRPRQGPIALRLSGSYLQYGSTTRRYNLVGLVDVDVTTRNQIGGFALGPQLHFGNGPMQLYGHGDIGFSYFFTRSYVEGTDQSNQPFASTTNHDDITFAADGGAGLLIRLSSGRTPILLDLGMRFVNNGRAEYVTEDSIDDSTNPPTVYAISSEANYYVYRLGLSFGLRPGLGGRDKTMPR